MTNTLEIYFTKRTSIKDLPSDRRVVFLGSGDFFYARESIRECFEFFRDGNGSLPFVPIHPGTKTRGTYWFIVHRSDDPSNSDYKLNVGLHPHPKEAHIINHSLDSDISTVDFSIEEVQAKLVLPHKIGVYGSLDKEGRWGATETEKKDLPKLIYNHKKKFLVRDPHSDYNHPFL